MISYKEIDAIEFHAANNLGRHRLMAESDAQWFRWKEAKRRTIADHDAEYLRGKEEQRRLDAKHEAEYFREKADVQRRATEREAEHAREKAVCRERTASLMNELDRQAFEAKLGLAKGWANLIGRN